MYNKNELYACGFDGFVKVLPISYKLIRPGTSPGLNHNEFRGDVMQWKGVDDDDHVNLESDRDDYFYEKKRSVWHKFNIGNWPLRLGGRPERPFILIGAGLIVLIIVFIALIMKNPGKEENPFEAYKTKVKFIEEKIARLDKSVDRIAALDERAKTMEQLIQQLNRSNVAVSARIDAIAGDIRQMNKQIPTGKNVKTAAVKSGPVAKKQAATRYHTVRSGETLYRISRRYNIGLNELKLLNKLGAKALIHPGQKLIVGESL